MNTLFYNFKHLLLNDRFVYLAGPEGPTEEVQKVETEDSVPSNFSVASEQYTREAKNKGGLAAKQAIQNLTELAENSDNPENDAYTIRTERNRKGIEERVDKIVKSGNRLEFDRFIEGMIAKTSIAMNKQNPKVIKIYIEIIESAYIKWDRSINKPTAISEATEENASNLQISQTNPENDAYTIRTERNRKGIEERVDKIVKSGNRLEFDRFIEGMIAKTSIAMNKQNPKVIKIYIEIIESAYIKWDRSINKPTAIS